MVKESEDKAEDDKERKELIEARNKLDELIYRTDKSFKELGDKLSDEEKKELEESLEEGRTALKGDNKAELESAFERITKSSHKLAELMYKQASESSDQQADGSPEGPAEDTTAESEQASEQSNKKDDDVIDAEFTEK